MKLGIPLGWPDDASAIGREVSRLARRCDVAGLDSLWTADHLFQIPVTGLPRESPMLEGYATIAYLAGQTERIRLGVMVTSAVYRHPGMLIKAVTTLDVLSGGRIDFAVGAGWDVEEATALGVPFPPTAERFERLEELLRIAHQMWAGDASPFEGTHYQLARPLNSPPALQRPRPPILVAGSGERKTLRLVARYADACNFFDLPAPYGVDLTHKLDVLRGHCAAIGRDLAEIEVTVLTAYPAGGRRPLLDRIVELGALGVDHVIVMAPSFAWGEEVDEVLALVDDAHALG
jgi:F420-dependent oxidoreductase-like protein